MGRPKQLLPLDGRPLLERVVAAANASSLDEVVVEGIETPLPLFRALVREPAIIDGDYHIHWLEQYLAGQPSG